MNMCFELEIAEIVFEFLFCLEYYYNNLFFSGYRSLRTLDLQCCKPLVFPKSVCFLFLFSFFYYI